MKLSRASRTAPPVSRILYPASCILHPASCIPHPAPRIPHPAPPSIPASGVQITLQQDCRRHFVHFVLAVGAADPGLEEDTVRLRGGQALVHGLERNRKGDAQ